MLQMERSIPLRVLLIENNPDDVASIQHLLSHNETEIGSTVTAPTLAEGLRRLASAPFDVVLLDLDLPDSNGLETCAKAHATVPHVPLVVLTASDSASLAHRALEAGAQDFLVKGEIDRHVLLRSMRYAVERHQYQLALAQSESRLRSISSIIEVNADALLLIDDESRIVFANPAAEVLLELPAQELVGQPFRHPLQPGVTARLQLVAHDGTRRVTEITAAETEYGGRHAILASIRDVTEQVGAQSERLKNQQIQKMAVLAGGLAHDFNNFLTTVSLNLHLVKRRSNNVDTVAIIEDIEWSLGCARNLTQQLLRGCANRLVC